MINKKILVEFLMLTFCLAYLAASILIIFGQFGFSINSSIQESVQNLGMNIPFAIYILSPAIASYFVLKRNRKISGLKEWLKTVFYFKNNLFVYLFVFTSLALYFAIHIAVSGESELALPFYMFFFALPGNLVIGGLEESGWTYILWPAFDEKFGYILSSIYVSVIWLLWHVPLFLIPGTGHHGGMIDFWMFSIQIVAFRFLYGAIYRIAGKGYVFMCVLCHTMFNAASYTFGIPPTTWIGTVFANTTVIVISIIVVVIFNKKNKKLTA